MTFPIFGVQLIFLKPHPPHKINIDLSYFIAAISCQVYYLTLSYLKAKTLMFNKQLEKINNLLSSVKEESSLGVDSIALISNNISRPKTQSKLTNSRIKPKIPTQITLINEGIPKKYALILENLFRQKCGNLRIQFNAKNWQTFIKAFFGKNKLVNNQIEDQTINLNDFYFGETCIKQINRLLEVSPQLVKIKLNKNYIDPNKLIRLSSFKQLYLCNCKLGNDALESLFDNLHESVIQKISLSSPELKNRNQLTRYERLILLIKNSRTLHTLLLSNIEIRPNSMILENCRNTTLKHVDLSDNSNVKGICPSILSLNLSRNGITYPFNYPMYPNQLQYLNLSYNKIPYYHFKEFLKLTYFTGLKFLVLDHIKLDGDASAIQYFLQQSLGLLHLSLVDCDFSVASYIHIAHGIKHSRSLESADLTRNRVINEKVAESISHMLQGCQLRSIKMRHCDIKDHLGQIIFKNIHKNRTIETLDMMNNLLGDLTAKAICEQLKNAKIITTLLLQENIIKYKDMHEIQSYLEGNKYFSIYKLDKDYNQLIVLNKQIQEASIIINSESEKLSKLEKETEELHLSYVNKYKSENSAKKDQLKKQIQAIRKEQNQLINDINIRTSLPQMTEYNEYESRKQSFVDQSCMTSEVN